MKVGEIYNILANYEDDNIVVYKGEKWEIIKVFAEKFWVKHLSKTEHSIYDIGDTEKGFNLTNFTKAIKDGHIVLDKRHKLKCLLENSK